MLRRRADHAVLDEGNWSGLHLLRDLREKAAGQLGTSGSGNHFVEFGLLELERPDLGLEAGRYLALLSHSGSRGSGARIASHYTKVARDLHPELPKELSYLAWLELDSEPGQEYWQAMNLMGEYASGATRSSTAGSSASDPSARRCSRTSRTTTTSPGSSSTTAARSWCTARVRRRRARACSA